MPDADGPGLTFDRIAERYHDARPSYPAALFDDLEALAGLEASARVLEVGAGTGKATLPLAQRGYRITALEPGPALASVLRRNLDAFAGVEVLESTLEEAELEADGFDLVVAATSWHWVEQPRGYEQLTRALRPAGRSRSSRRCTSRCRRTATSLETCSLSTSRTPRRSAQLGPARSTRVDA